MIDDAVCLEHVLSTDLRTKAGAECIKPTIVEFRGHDMDL